MEKSTGKPKKNGEAGRGKKISPAALRASRVAAAERKTARYPAGNSRKTPRTLKLKTGRAGTKGKSGAVLPRWIWAAGGAVVLALLIAWLLHTPAPKKGNAPAASSPVTGTGGVPNSQSPSPALPDAAVPVRSLAFIRTVRLEPMLPTRRDILKAEVQVAPTAPGKLTYTYQWKVNDRIVEKATGNTLDLSPFKKRDLATVTVTPYDGDTAGFAVAGPVVAIQSISPTLELKDAQQTGKKGAPLELQLVSVAPDSDQLVFSLEDPLVAGMTVDRQSGKITWRIQPEQKGTIRFGASVEDENRTKITRNFGITVK